VVTIRNDSYPEYLHRCSVEDEECSSACPHIGDHGLEDWCCKATYRSILRGAGSGRCMESICIPSRRRKNE
jgi:hypothetical protein